MFAMITAQHIRERLGARPFKPFRVCLSDGTTHDMPQPEFAWVLATVFSSASPLTLLIRMKRPWSNCPSCT